MPIIRSGQLQGFPVTIIQVLALVRGNRHRTRRHFQRLDTITVGELERFTVVGAAELRTGSAVVLCGTGTKSSHADIAVAGGDHTGIVSRHAAGLVEVIVLFVVPQFHTGRHIQIPAPPRKAFTAGTVASWGLNLKTIGTIGAFVSNRLGTLCRTNPCQIFQSGRPLHGDVVVFGQLFAVHRIGIAIAASLPAVLVHQFQSRLYIVGISALHSDENIAC